jgi:tRNA threonylcarbamoyladenosine biosynthesis protein TsaB
VYVSVGPGSFTGLRVGITTARTLAQALPRVRCVAVPTAWAIAEQTISHKLQWENLGVIMDARRGEFHASLFARGPDGAVEILPGGSTTAAEFLSAAPRPLVLVGEGLPYADISAPQVTIVEPAATHLHLPTAEGVWRLGRKLATAGRFTDYNRLLPIYARKPEALRLWQMRPQA